MKLIIDIPEEKYEWVKNNNPNVDINSIIGAIANGIPYEERSKEEWIPVKTRPLTEEEKEVYHYSFMYDCRMPEDGEEVLVTTKYGVCTDIYSWDSCGCYFECHCDDGEVLAWKRFPQPYKEGDKE